MMPQQIDSIAGAVRGQEPRVRSRRSALEVRMDILTVLRDGAEGPTQIMYKANLSWIAATQHLKELVDSAILSEQNVKNRFTYTLTEKGLSILRSYMQVVDQINAPDYYARHPGF